MSALLFDTETTGTRAPQVIEAAWLKLDTPANLTILEEFEQRYKPSEAITLGALAVHHIYDEELASCPSHTTFQLPADTQYIIGHNVDYDWEVAGKPDVKRICTLALSKQLFPQLDSHSQSALIYYIDRANARERLKNAHSALADVRNCLDLLRALLNAMPTPVNSWEELWRYSDQARVPTIMPFGKHRGMPIADLPPDYKAWLLRQDGLDPYVKMAVQANF
ncbi:putative quorum-sensing-regulated virulence factor [Paenalcaligenes sp. Me52]|uniref:putative quorum-sensing-regulated virulence factor n=1 Tax=Paenalcaligenes sp. Me52 TaxID=3392038 RepID=UPI003D295DEA